MGTELRYKSVMSLTLTDLRAIRASLFHQFDGRYGAPPAHHLANALENLEVEIERLEHVGRMHREEGQQDDACKVVSIELARAKKLLD